MPGDRIFPRGLAAALRQGSIGVMPTDTIYGIVGSAFDPEAVARIYRLRKRNAKKPFIILISSIASLAKFGIKPDVYRRAFLKEAWPGRVSIILPLPAKKYAKQYEYLHRGTGSLAFRLPDAPPLRALVSKTGALVAPSANWEGERPARTIKEAQKFFGHEIEFYIDGGRIAGKASSLIDLSGDAPVVLRK